MRAWLERWARAGVPLVPTWGIVREPSGRLVCECRKGANCPRPGKHPRIKAWNERASSDLGTLLAWARRWPHANWAASTSGRFVVVDVDGPEGRETLRGWQANGHALPPTFTVRTGRGLHLWYEAEEPLRSVPELGPKVELHAQGWLAMVPPSLHVCGRRYEVVKKRSPAPLPAWVRDRARANVPAGGRCAPSGGPISEGNRNQAFFRLGAALVGRGLPRSLVSGALRGANDALDAPLPPDEVEGIVRSLDRYDPEDPPMTDRGNLQAFLRIYGPFVRRAAKDWFVWDGERWVLDDSGHVFALCIDLPRVLHEQARRIGDEEKRKARLAWARKTESSGRIKAVQTLLEGASEIAVKRDRFDADPWVLNTRSGILNLRTAAVRPARPDDYVSRRAPVAWDPNAHHERWERFVHEIMGGDQEMVEYLQRAAGYSITGLTDEQVFFSLHGAGANGKSTFMEAIQGVVGLGGGYMVKTPFTTFLRRRGSDSPRNDLARFQGARIVMASESNEGQVLDEALIKEITGGEHITARFLYREFFTFLPRFKVWLLCNHKPEIRGTDHAIWRRVHLIPFDVVFTKGRRDPTLLRQFQTPEAKRAILRWLVDGCRAWQERGLDPPRRVRRATTEYRREQDVLGAFLQDTVTVVGLEGDQVPEVASADLYMAYSLWCRRYGHGACGHQKFSRLLMERPEIKGRVERVRRSRGRFLRGIRLEGT